MCGTTVGCVHLVDMLSTYSTTSPACLDCRYRIGVQIFTVTLVVHFFFFELHSLILSSDNQLLRICMFRVSSEEGKILLIFSIFCLFLSIQKIDNDRCKQIQCTLICWQFRYTWLLLLSPVPREWLGSCASFPDIALWLWHCLPPGEGTMLDIAGTPSCIRSASRSMVGAAWEFLWQLRKPSSKEMAEKPKDVSDYSTAI